MWILAALSAFASHRTDKAEELAAQAQEEDDPFRAGKLARKAVRLDPGNVAAHFAQGLAFGRMAQLVSGESAQLLQTMALDEWRVVVALAPDGRMGAIARDALKPDPLLIPEPECPPDAAASYARAEQLLAAGERGGAREAYTAAVTGCPTNPVWWVHAGDAYWPEEPQAALERYQKGVELYPCHWQGLRFVADALSQLGRGPDAADALLRSVACNPTYEAGWTDAVAVTQAHGGDVRLERPLTVPVDAGSAEAAGPAWAAWWAWRAQHGAATLTDAVAAVRAGLAAGSGPGWDVLRAADAGGTLDQAVLVLLFEPELASELIQWNGEQPDALPSWIRANVLVR